MRRMLLCATILAMACSGDKDDETTADSATDTDTDTDTLIVDSRHSSPHSGRDSAGQTGATGFVATGDTSIMMPSTAMTGGTGIVDTVGGTGTGGSGLAPTGGTGAGVVTGATGATADTAVAATTGETGGPTETGPTDTGPVDFFSLALVPDFSVLDVNDTSPTFNTLVSPRQFTGKATAWYFAHATWSTCQSQFGSLSDMQAELDLAGVDIQIIGVNEVGYDSGNAAMTAGRDLPFLQDDTTYNVWDSWDVTYRDVILVDADGKPTQAYNLTVNSLTVAANYDALKDLLTDLATP